MKFFSLYDSSDVAEGQFEDLALSWTGLRGRLTDSVPPVLGELRDLHVHLVGNGEMVNLFRPALHEAGVPKGQVSIETYFNHHAEAANKAVEALVQRFPAGG